MKDYKVMGKYGIESNSVLDRANKMHARYFTVAVFFFSDSKKGSRLLLVDREKFPVADWPNPDSNSRPFVVQPFIHVSSLK